MENFEINDTEYGVTLKESASDLTQGNECDYGEAWGGLRGKKNC